MTNTAKATISPASITMLEVILENEKACYPHPWSEQAITECFNGKYQCFVMCVNEDIVGHLIYQLVLDELHLHNVCLLPEMRGQSLGRRWMEFLIQRAKQGSAKTIFLEVRASNNAAIKLYQGFNFETLAIRKNYYRSHSGQEDAKVMSLTL
jgi:ribosomal-protein-alanine N-acetyltransferase